MLDCGGKDILNRKIVNNLFLYMLIIGIILTNNSILTLHVEAATKNTNAKKAYSELLSKSTILWENKYSTTKLNFSCIDINDDGISELIVKNEAASYSEGYYKIYAYISGKVKCIWTGFSDKPIICSDNGLIYDRGSHMDYTWEHYYLFDSKTASFVASHESFKIFDDDFNYVDTSQEYKISGKTVAESEFTDYIDELIGYSHSTSYTLVNNTSANRNKYLAKTVYSYEDLGIDTSKTISSQIIKKMTSKKLYYYKSSTNYNNLDAGSVNKNKTYSLAISPSCKYYLNDGSGIGDDCLKKVSYSTFQKDSYWMSVKITVKNNKIVQMVQLYMP